MAHTRFSQYIPLLAITLFTLMLASCQIIGTSQKSATWEEQYGTAQQAAASIDPNVALYKVRNFAGESEVIYTFIRPSGELIRITFPSPGSTSILNIEQTTIPVNPLPSQQRLDDFRRGVHAIQISLSEAYHLTAREKAWLAAQAQAPVTQFAQLRGGNDSLWSIQYESGNRSAPDYRSLVIHVDVQTGEFRRCIMLQGKDGKERNEQCPEVNEDATE